MSRKPGRKQQSEVSPTSTSKLMTQLNCQIPGQRNSTLFWFTTPFTTSRFWKRPLGNFYASWRRKAFASLVRTSYLQTQRSRWNLVVQLLLCTHSACTTVYLLQWNTQEAKRGELAWVRNWREKRWRPVDSNASPFEEQRARTRLTGPSISTERSNISALKV